MLVPCLAEAPYAPAGFRPSTPFDLPGEYYTDDAVYDPNQGYSFEISKQRVDFVGQEVQRVPAVSEPQNQYLPPNQFGFNDNRDSPNNQRPQWQQFFHHKHNHGRRNGRPTEKPSTDTPQNRPPLFQQNFPPINVPTQPPQFQPNLPPTNVPTQKPNTDERFESQHFFPRDQQQKPALQYGAPNYNIDPRNNKQQQANINQQQLSLEYGAPNNNNNLEQQPALVYGAPGNIDSLREEELEKQFALEALKAAVDNYNRLQENNNDKIAQGQYFVVNPDHSIQKVKFTTKKSKDESRPTDFSAELNYTKVGEINDPLYKYTSEGQLVRIVKK